MSAPLFSRYRHALVTGASGGLGRAFAEMLLTEGIHVTGTARDTARLAPLTLQANFTPLALDLADVAGVETIFARASDAAGEGGFDLVINNAGYGVFAPFAAADFFVWQTQFDAMISATARLSHAALRRMLAQRRGCLVNVASLATEFPLPFMSGYNVAKAALSALSESLLFETRGTGLTVMDFRPGDYRTAFNQAMRPPAFSSSAADPRLPRVWRALAQHLDAAPAPEKAARDLRRALRAGRGGVVRSGTFFQAVLAPWFARFAPAGLRRAVIAHYQGAG